MPASITLSFSEEVLKALRKGQPLRLALVSTARAAARAPRRKNRTAGSPDEGSLPARIRAWALSTKGPFGPWEVQKALKVSRPHASMLLTRCLREGVVRRQSRGVYVRA